MARKLTDTPVAGGASPASAELIRAMMASDRNERVPSYDDLLARIDDLLERASPKPVRKRRTPRRRFVPSATAVAVAGLLAAGFSLRPGPTRNEPAPPVRYESAGLRALFTGSPDVGPWVRGGGGVWAVEKDEE